MGFPPLSSVSENQKNSIIFILEFLNVFSENKIQEFPGSSKFCASRKDCLSKSVNSDGKILMGSV